MIDHVLIAEDHETVNLSLRKTLEDLKITRVDHVYYCDDALLKIKNNLQKDPYDLLITDLFFEEDNNAQALQGGMELIKAARELQPGLKVLIFSAENRPGNIKEILEEFQVDGFVRKARNDAWELKNAIEKISHGHSYVPRSITQLIAPANTHQFSEFDITVISLLSEGYHQKDIPDYLKSKNIRPSSLSSVEKRLNSIKEALAFSKNEQLVAYCKDMGLF